MNLIWAPRKDTDEPWMAIHDVERLFRRTKVALVIALVIAVTGFIFFLVGASRTRPLLVVTGDHRAFYGIQQSPDLDEAMFEAHAIDVVEGTFFRTEAGGIDAMIDRRSLDTLKAKAKEWATKQNKPVPEISALPPEKRSQLLTALVHPDVLATVNRAASESTKNFYQSFSALEVRLPEASPVQVVVLLRGQMISRNLANYSNSEAFVAALFRPTMKSEANPLGWRLDGLKKITADVFYAKEQAEKVQQSTRVNAPPKS